MKSFDPDFSKFSNEQLAEIDSLCSEYEAKRTQGDNVTIEMFLLKSALEIRSSLKCELIQIEMEILDTWDQLRSPEAMIERFPDQKELILKQWESLEKRTGPRLANFPNRDTLSNVVPFGSTHDEGHNVQSMQEADNESLILDDPSQRFRIIRNLAQGGIGNVFVAFDRDLQREVAIKELKRKFVNDRAVTQRFEVEATVTGNLEHPNIVPIYATGRRSDGRPFYAMRLIHGRSMQAVISDLHNQHNIDLDFRRNPIGRDLLLRFVTFCRAVGFAHSRGVLHRDLKPSNIMVGDFGETLVVDWGLARHVESVDSSQKQSVRPHSGVGSRARLNCDKTLDGTIVGTPGYMSPEQAVGRNDEITIASDIYSLGATLFQILTNQIPYLHTGNVAPGVQSDTGVYIADRLKNGSPVALSKFGTFPAALNAICGHAMQFDPQTRYANAELLAADLEAWLLDEPVSVLPETGLQRVRRWARSHPATVAGGLASLLFTLLAMGITLSILSIKNESLRQSYVREQTAAQESAQNAAIAQKNGDEAVRQRERVLGILRTFLFDVESGLDHVPGGAAVQRNVLTTVLNKLGEISKDFAVAEVNSSNAKALVEMGDLFSRIGTKDIKLEMPGWNQKDLSPLEAASEMYAEAMKIATQSSSPDGKVDRRMIAMIQEKQAEILRQTARTPEAKKLLEESLATRRILLAESPDSVDAAMDVVFAVDRQIQILLQDGDTAKAKIALVEVQTILEGLSAELPDDIDVKRRLGIILSRLADIAVKEGDLDLASQLYDQDFAIATDIYQRLPNSLIAKRDLCGSLDRIGNMSAQRGQLEKAMESYLESRRLRAELLAAEPANTTVMYELFVSYIKGGDMQMLLKDVATAKEDYEKALMIADEMARIDPTSANARRLQSISADRLADVSIQEGQLDKALQYARKSLEIGQELRGKDPTDDQKQKDVFICHVKVAKALLAMENFEASLAELNNALPIVQPTYERQPDSLEFAKRYSNLLLAIAEVQLAMGNAQESAKQCEAVISVLETVPEDKRQDALTRLSIVNTLTILGRAQIVMGKTAEARAALGRAKQLAVAMIDEGMRVEQMQVALTEIDDLISTAVENR